jgi:hypothetical protein
METLNREHRYVTYYIDKGNSVQGKWLRQSFKKLKWCFKKHKEIFTYKATLLYYFADLCAFYNSSHNFLVIKL